MEGGIEHGDVGQARKSRARRMDRCQRNRVVQRRVGHHLLEFGQHGRIDTDRRRIPRAAVRDPVRDGAKPGDGSRVRGQFGEQHGERRGEVADLEVAREAVGRQARRLVESGQADIEQALPAGIDDRRLQ